MAVSRGFKNASGFAQGKQDELNAEGDRNRKIVGDYWYPPNTLLYFAGASGRVQKTIGKNISEDIMDDVICTYNPGLKKWNCYATPSVLPFKFVISVRLTLNTEYIGRQENPFAVRDSYIEKDNDTHVSFYWDVLGDKIVGEVAYDDSNYDSATDESAWSLDNNLTEHNAITGDGLATPIWDTNILSFNNVYGPSTGNQSINTWDNEGNYLHPPLFGPSTILYLNACYPYGTDPPLVKTWSDSSSNAIVVPAAIVKSDKEPKGYSSIYSNMTSHRLYLNTWGGVPRRAMDKIYDRTDYDCIHPYHEYYTNTITGETFLVWNEVIHNTHHYKTWGYRRVEGALWDGDVNETQDINEKVYLGPLGEDQDWSRNRNDNFYFTYNRAAPAIVISSQNFSGKIVYCPSALWKNDEGGVKTMGKNLFNDDSTFLSYFSIASSKSTREFSGQNSANSQYINYATSALVTKAEDSEVYTTPVKETLVNIVWSFDKNKGISNYSKLTGLEAKIKELADPADREIYELILGETIVTDQDDVEVNPVTYKTEILKMLDLHEDS